MPAPQPVAPGKPSTPEKPPLAAKPAEDCVNVDPVAVAADNNGGWKVMQGPTVLFDYGSDAKAAERAWKAGEDIAEALQRDCTPVLDEVDPAQRAKLETLNGIHSNAAGLRLWLERTRDHQH